MEKILNKDRDRTLVDRAIDIGFCAVHLFFNTKDRSPNDPPVTPPGSPLVLPDRISGDVGIHL